ncbi:MAG TPA: hypothetical protein VLE02_01565 [Nitrosarchaeum sp.]|nr:hypothetical protein [Nitrosarchaeum sp.]
MVYYNQHLFKLMKGYFVCINTTYNHAYVYNVEYEKCLTIPYEMKGTWKPTEMCIIDSICHIIPHPGVPLMLRGPDVPYFHKFCSEKKIACDGWMENEEFPYVITRCDKSKRMFLVLRMNEKCQPVDTSHENMLDALERNGVDTELCKVHEIYSQEIYSQEICKKF